MAKTSWCPNDRFITTRVINWTHADPRQRYEVPFTVTYDTDIHKVPPLIVKALLKLKGVLREPEMPECALKSFNDTNISFTAKFWVEGIDDGVNSYTSDALFAIWDALQDAGHFHEDAATQDPICHGPRAKKAQTMRKLISSGSTFESHHGLFTRGGGRRLVFCLRHHRL